MVGTTTSTLVVSGGFLCILHISTYLFVQVSLPLGILALKFKKDLCFLDQFCFMYEGLLDS